MYFCSWVKSWTLKKNLEYNLLNYVYVAAYSGFRDEKEYLIEHETYYYHPKMKAWYLYDERKQIWNFENINWQDMYIMIKLREWFSIMYVVVVVWLPTSVRDGSLRRKKKSKIKNWFSPWNFSFGFSDDSWLFEFSSILGFSGSLSESLESLSDKLSSGRSYTSTFGFTGFGGSSASIA